MVDSIDEESENRMYGYLNLKNIKSERDFWTEYWEKFGKGGSVKVGKFLLEKVKREKQEIPKTTPRITYYEGGLKYQKYNVKIRHRHYIKYRDVKTGRFISLKTLRMREGYP